MCFICSFCCRFPSVGEPRLCAVGLMQMGHSSLAPIGCSPLSVEKSSTESHTSSRSQPLEILEASFPPIVTHSTPASAIGSRCVTEGTESGRSRAKSTSSEKQLFDDEQKFVLLQDHRAYIHVGIPEAKIFIIDTAGVIHHISNSTYART